MKLDRLSNCVHKISRYRSEMVSPWNLYSTKALGHLIYTRQWDESSTNELFHRISPVRNQNVSLVPILDQWVKEGGPVNRDFFIDIIRRLRSFRRYNHALQISMWMTDKKYHVLTSSDVAIRLDLILKDQGIDGMEKYVHTVPQNLIGFDVYGALLSCYATWRCVEKAEAIMQKMKDLGYAVTASLYNAMLTLYQRTKNMEKFDTLLQEMEEEGIIRNGFTISIQINAYAAAMDIEKMDKVVRMLESDPDLVSDWTSYTAAANGYKKAGLLDKASEMLKKAEARVTTQSISIAYNHLLTQYAGIGRKDEVLRVWSVYKKECKVDINGYMCVLNSLAKVGDIEMVEKVFDEWESQNTGCDIHVSNILVNAYSKQGLFEKAEAIIDKVISKGGKPNCWSWYFFATGYLERDQPEKAVEMMKRAIVLSERLWKPSCVSLEACVEHLKGVAGMEEAEKFVKLLMNKSIISNFMHEKLLNLCKKSVENGATMEFTEPVKEDGIQN
ncbi:Tetratricopeptide repeat (TPR)-like superfamily protein [Euphorbia peplus]|nr:Tetratricopeptide repeat (TPR)-like superfamily protein [Euphorbia peplus]